MWSSAMDRRRGRWQVCWYLITYKAFASFYQCHFQAFVPNFDCCEIVGIQHQFIVFCDVSHVWFCCENDMTAVLLRLCQHEIVSLTSLVHVELEYFRRGQLYDLTQFWIRTTAKYKFIDSTKNMEKDHTELTIWKYHTPTTRLTATAWARKDEEQWIRR